jgi:hypothetical protein
MVLFDGGQGKGKGCRIAGAFKLDFLAVLV